MSVDDIILMTVLTIQDGCLWATFCYEICVEYIFVYISRTACDSSMKFYMYINLDKGHHIQDKKDIGMMGSMVKNCLVK